MTSGCLNRLHLIRAGRNDDKKFPDSPFAILAHEASECRSQNARPCRRVEYFQRENIAAAEDIGVLLKGRGKPPSEIGSIAQDIKAVQVGILIRLAVTMFGRKRTGSGSFSFTGHVFELLVSTLKADTDNHLVSDAAEA